MATDEHINDEAGGDIGLEDPGPTADEIAGISTEELFEIGMGNQPCEDKKVKREAQSFVALMMRKQGHGYQVIANEMGVSLGWAHGLVQRVLKKTVKETAEQVRLVQLDRLETMLAGVWDRAEGGDSFAITSALAIMDRIDKLHGIEPPKRIEHTFTDDAVNETRSQLAKALAALSEPDADAGAPGETPPAIH